MNTQQRLSIIAMTLMLSGSMAALAETETTYGIRPADDASASPSSHPNAADEQSLKHSSMIKNSGDIRYVSGGVGESERSELNALSSQFNLHLLFATQGSGEYLSAVQVNILDTNHGSILSAESKGPWFYAQLPPGDYTVQVTPTESRGHGQTQEKTVHLDRSGQAKFDFYWNK